MINIDNSNCGCRCGQPVKVGWFTDMSYTDLRNKPKINGVEILGDKAAGEFGIANTTDIVPTVNKEFENVDMVPDRYNLPMMKDKINELVGILKGAICVAIACLIPFVSSAETPGIYTSIVSNLWSDSVVVTNVKISEFGYITDVRTNGISVLDGSIANIDGLASTNYVTVVGTQTLAIAKAYTDLHTPGDYENVSNRAVISISNPEPWVAPGLVLTKTTNGVAWVAPQGGGAIGTLTQIRDENNKWYNIIAQINPAGQIVAAIEQSESEHRELSVLEEQARAMEAENTIRTNLVSETSRAVAAETDLESKIREISALGRFLSTWNASIGTPGTEPKTHTLEYMPGDYYIVGKVGEPGFPNYIPSGEVYTQGVASTEVSHERVSVNDVYRFTAGGLWTHVSMAGVEMMFENIGGEPTNNVKLALALLNAGRAMNFDVTETSGGLASSMTHAQICAAYKEGRTLFAQVKTDGFNGSMCLSAFNTNNYFFASNEVVFVTIQSRNDKTINRNLVIYEIGGVTMVRIVDYHSATTEELLDVETNLVRQIVAETNRAQIAERALDVRLVSETNRAQIAEYTISTNLLRVIGDEYARATNEETRISSELVSETNRAQVAEAGLDTRLVAETNRAQVAERALDVRLVSETNRAQIAERALDVRLVSETNRAQTAEQALDARLVAETNRSQVAEAALATDLVAETNRAQVAEASIAADLVAETNRAQVAEASISADLVAEKIRAQVAESAIASDLVTETNRAQVAEAVLAADLVAETNRAQVAEAALAADLVAETNRAQADEAAIAADLVTETNRAQVAEAVLTADLVAETNRAQVAESAITADLVAETNRAQVAESAITANLVSETNRAHVAELALKGMVIATSNAIETAIAPVRTTANSALQPGDVINNTTSSDTDKPLSANMGKELQEQISNLQQRGRYLSVWNSVTGKPQTTPTVDPYQYKAGDYYIVGVVSALTPAVNYRPDGTTFSTNTPSTVVESSEVKVNDTYYFDGTNWSLLQAEQKEITFASLIGSPYDNTNLANALTGISNYTYSVSNNLQTSVSNLGSDLVAETNRAITADTEIRKRVLGLESSTNYWNAKQDKIADYTTTNAVCNLVSNTVTKSYVEGLGIDFGVSASVVTTIVESAAVTNVGAVTAATGAIMPVLVTETNRSIVADNYLNANKRDIRDITLQPYLDDVLYPITVAATGAVVTNHYVVKNADGTFSLKSEDGQEIAVFSTEGKVLGDTMLWKFNGRNLSTYAVMVLVHDGDRLARMRDVPELGVTFDSGLQKTNLLNQVETSRLDILSIKDKDVVQDDEISKLKRKSYWVGSIDTLTDPLNVDAELDAYVTNTLHRAAFEGDQVTVKDIHTVYQRAGDSHWRVFSDSGAVETSSKTQYGVVKIGEGIAVSNGVISVSKEDGITVLSTMSFETWVDDVANVPVASSRIVYCDLATGGGIAAAALYRIYKKDASTVVADAYTISNGKLYRKIKALGTWGVFSEIGSGGGGGGGSTEWGSIGGSIDDQLDLKSALGDKLNVADVVQNLNDTNDKHAASIVALSSLAKRLKIVNTQSELPATGSQDAFYVGRADLKCWVWYDSDSQYHAISGGGGGGGSVSTNYVGYVGYILDETNLAYRVMATRNKYGEVTMNVEQSPSTVDVVTVEAEYVRATNVETRLYVAVSNKQDKLPVAVRSKYLHANAVSGEIEWSDVAGGGGSFIEDTNGNRIEADRSVTSATDVFTGGGDILQRSITDENKWANGSKSVWWDGTAWKCSGYEAGSVVVASQGSGASATELIVSQVTLAQVTLTRSAATRDYGKIVTSLEVTRQIVFDLCHPVNSVWIQYTANDAPNTLFNGNGVSSTWTDITSTMNGRYLQFDSANAAATVKAEKLPNIKGAFRIGSAGKFTSNIFMESGAFYGSDSQYQNNYNSATQQGIDWNVQANFDASRSSSVYQNSAPVQPLTYTVKVWKRTN